MMYFLERTTSANANHLFLNNMHDSTLDLFADHDIMMNLEELAKKFEVTVDYLMMEFLIDDDDTERDWKWTGLMITLMKS